MTGAAERRSPARRLWRAARTRLVPPWVAGYGAAALRGDLLAGLTVAVMLVPQGMAYALLAGLPPYYGLYASMVPLVAYALLGTSRQLAAGIVALDMLIVGAALAEMEATTPAAAAGVALTLSLMVGGIQLVLGAGRLGFITDFISRPVIVGFTTAAPLLIGLSQIGNLTGMELPRSSHLIGIGEGIYAHFTEIHPASTILGVAAVAWLWAGRRFRPRLPHALAVVALGTLAVYALDLPAQGVRIIGPVASGLPAIALPAGLDVDTVQSLFGTAVTLVLIQLVTVISMGKMIASRTREAVYPNRELVALGAGNLLGGLCQSPPTSASFSRTAVNMGANAQSPLSNAVAAAIVVVAVLTLDEALAYIPLPVLAAIILVSAIGMIDPRETQSIFGLHRVEGAVAALTMAVTLLVGIEEGVLLGIGASVALMLYRASRPRIAVLEAHPETGRLVDRTQYDDTRALPNVLVLRVDGALHFANAEFMRRAVLETVDRTREPPLRVLLDGRGINGIDVTAAGVLRDLLDDLELRGVELVLTGFKASPRRMIDRSNLDERVATIEFSAAEVLDLLDAPDDEAS